MYVGACFFSSELTSTARRIQGAHGSTSPDKSMSIRFRSEIMSKKIRWRTTEKRYLAVTPGFYTHNAYESAHMHARAII